MRLTNFLLSFVLLGILFAIGVLGFAKFYDNEASRKVKNACLKSCDPYAITVISNTCFCNTMLKRPTR